jgi:hypothetical protein
LAAILHAVRFICRPGAFLAARLPAGKRRLF